MLKYKQFLEKINKDNSIGYGVVNLDTITKNEVIGFIEDSFNKINYTRTFFLEDVSEIKAIERVVEKLKRNIKRKIVNPNSLNYSVDCEFDNKTKKQLDDIVSQLDTYTSTDKMIGAMNNMITILVIKKEELQNTKMPNYGDNKQYANWVFNKIKSDNKLDTNGLVFWYFIKTIAPLELKRNKFLREMGVVDVIGSINTTK